MNVQVFDVLLSSEMGGGLIMLTFIDERRGGCMGRATRQSSAGKAGARRRVLAERILSFVLGSKRRDEIVKSNEVKISNTLQHYA